MAGKSAGSKTFQAVKQLFTVLQESKGFDSVLAKVRYKIEILALNISIFFAKSLKKVSLTEASKFGVLEDISNLECNC